MAGRGRSDAFTTCFRCFDRCVTGLRGGYPVANSSMLAIGAPTPYGATRLCCLLDEPIDDWRDHRASDRRIASAIFALPVSTVLTPRSTFIFLPLPCEPATGYRQGLSSTQPYRKFESQRHIAALPGGCSFRPSERFALACGDKWQSGAPLSPTHEPVTAACGCSISAGHARPIARWLLASTALTDHSIRRRAIGRASSARPMEHTTLSAVLNRGPPPTKTPGPSSASRLNTVMGSLSHHGWRRSATHDRGLPPGVAARPGERVTSTSRRQPG